MWQVSLNSLKKKMEKVSIIIPYKEDRGFLAEAIESVERQSYKNIELILSSSNQGVSYNLNRGIEKATGRYIKYLCDDDRLPEKSIEYSVMAMADKGCDFIHANATLFFPNGAVQRWIPSIHKPSLADMLIRNQIHGGTLMYDRSVFKRFGLFNECLWTAEEYEFNLRILSRGAKIGYTNQYLYDYRRHSKQKSIGNLERSYQMKRQEAIEDIKSMYR